MMNSKYFNFKHIAIAAFVGCAAMFASCAESIELGEPVDEGLYQGIYQNNGYLRDAKTNLTSNVVELRAQSYQTSIKLGLTKAPTAATKAKVSIDAAYLATYNKEHKTNFELYPADLIAFGNDGVFSFDPKSYFSGELSMTITAGANLEAGKTYIIPVAVTDASSDLTLKQSARYCIYMVKDSRALSDCFKGEDMTKGFLYFEVNGVNPLNTFSFELENGKLLWDVVVLFAANINYNSETQRPYINCNTNVQFLLDNNETYLQPLRKRGVKVLLGLLGNHDQTGLAQLSKIGAQDFAKEVAAYCEIYNLDGVNYDDEYSKAPDLSNPALAPLNRTAGARLCYETKLLMPDKMVTVYDWGDMYGTPSVDGVDIDQWLDVCVANYGYVGRPIGNMTKKKTTTVSLEFANGSGGTLDAASAQKSLDGGFGWFMGFAPSPRNYTGLNPSNRNIFSRLTGTKTLYGVGLKPPTVFYRKNDPTPYRYPEDLTAQD